MSVSSPRISLIIALYNAEKYLRPCLDSVKAQTFKDFECLCINDGSKDTTEAIVKEYAESDPRFKLINQVNAGCSAARNAGLNNAAAPYVALLDQDDMLHPQAFETLICLIEKYQTDVASFRFIEVPDSFVLSNPPHYDIRSFKARVSETPFQDFFNRKKGGQVEVWTRLYNKKAIAGIEFPVGIQPAEDTIFTLKVLDRIKNIVTVDEKLLYYRDSSTSVMNMGKTRRYVESHLKAGQVLYDYFVKEPRLKGQDLENMRFFITRLFYKTCISQALRRINDPELRREVLDLSRQHFVEFEKQQMFLPSKLKFKHRLAYRLFMKRWNGLARLLA